MDAKSAEALWWLPDKNGKRVHPEASAVWHGAIYGETTNGPVIVDARSGRDRTTSLTIVPELVNAYVGIVEDEASGKTIAYPAIG